MEIERKYLIPFLPENIAQYPSKELVQAYLCRTPVVRIRREGDDYVLTYKGAGMMEREEYNLPLTKEGFDHMLPKADGIVISKTRYYIPFICRHLDYTIELDVFHNELDGLLLAEVEFPNREQCESFLPPAWFGEEVTFSPQYHNSSLSGMSIKGIQTLLNR